MPVSRPNDELCAIYIDMGTTNTRAWLALGDLVIANAAAPVGARDTARSGSSAQLHAGLRDLITRVRAEAAKAEAKFTPEYIAAAGMITSSLGLLEVPHIRPPAGASELAAASQWRDFPELTDLLVLLVPGVRSGPEQVDVDSVRAMDVMRGEETLCAGLVALGLMKPPAIVLNLGSHWKAIALDEEGKIRSSVTSLSGELIHALQSQTILAGSISKQRPSRIDPSWLEAGMRDQRAAGLSRALFCARLLDLARQGSAEQRFAHVMGAVIAADLDALILRKVLSSHTNVVLVGASAVSEAWRYALTQNGITADVIGESDAEKALLTGLRTILMESLRSGTRQAISQERGSK
jgi:2-dehydro-3-deoxygalactonokinase